MVIYLDCPSPDSSSEMFPFRNAAYPETRRAAVWSPVWPCFRWGLHSIFRYRKTGGLLHRHSTLTRFLPGGIISVALSRESPPPDVIRHPALRSPDFPQLSPRPSVLLYLLFYLMNQARFTGTDELSVKRMQRSLNESSQRKLAQMSLVSHCYCFTLFYIKRGIRFRR